MALLERLVVILPLALSIVGLVLSTLSLYAGSDKGFMEDYAVARLNVSMLGQDLIETSSDSSSDDDGSDDDGLLGDIENTIDDITDQVVDEINDLLGDAVDDVANALGIKDWYSIHIMDACEGNYEPNGTAKNPSLNVTECTKASANNQINITALLNEELSVGPFDITLEDLGWDDDIQKQIDKINDVLLGLVILYALGMGFSAAGICGCLAAALRPSCRITGLVNIVVATLGALSLLVASIIVTVAVTRGIDEINDMGEDIGVSVSRGDNFLIITWVATAVMLCATIFWAVRFFMIKRQAKRALRSKEGY